MDAYDNPFQSEAIHRYFSELLSLKGEEALDRQGVIKEINNGSFAFRSISEHFHLIESNTVPILIPMNGGENLLQRILAGEISRSLMRLVSHYSVNVYQQHFDALFQAGDIQSAGDNEWYLSNLELYSMETGLSLKKDFGKAEFI